MLGSGRAPRRARLWSSDEDLVEAIAISAWADDNVTVAAVVCEGVSLGPVRRRVSALIPPAIGAEGRGAPWPPTPFGCSNTSTVITTTMTVHCTASPHSSPYPECQGGVCKPLGALPVDRVDALIELANGALTRL